MTGDRPERGITRKLMATAGTAAVGALALAHLRVQGVGLGFSGSLLLLDHLYNVALVLGFLLVCRAAGRRALRRWLVSGCEAVDRFLLSLVAGAGILAVPLLVLGLAGLLGPLAVMGVTGLLVAWAREELAETPAVIRSVGASVPAPVWVAAALVGAALLLPALSPPTDWDSLMYHLHLPRRFLEEGRLFFPADTHHVAFVGLAHMLYLPLMVVGSPSAPALLSLAFALLLPVAVYRLGVRTVGTTAGEMAGIAVWGTTTVLLVAVTARVDVTLVLFLTVGHLALYQACTGEGGRKWIVLAGIGLGLALGVKYQAGAYLIALSPLVLSAVVRGDGGEGPSWRDAAVLAGVTAVVASPWFLKNWMVLDAPFYPFLAERLLPPWLAELYGTPVVPGSVSREIFGALGEVRRPFDLLDAFFRPEALSVEGEAVHYRLGPLLLAVPAVLFWLRDRAVLWLVVPPIGYMALVLGMSPRTNLRYLLPAVPALTVAASMVAVRAVEWVSSRVAAGRSGEDGDGTGGGGGSSSGERSTIVRAVALGLATASLVPTGVSLAQWAPGETSLAHLAGAQSRMEYLSQRRNPALVTHAGLTDFGERPLPDDARVLLMFEAREFYFTVPALQDPLLTNWSLLAPLRGQIDCLRSTDITHVLVGRGVLEYYVGRGLDPETVRWPAFRDFARRCLEKDLEVPGFVLYRVPERTSSARREDTDQDGDPPP